MFVLLHKVRGILTGSPHHKYSLGGITADFHSRCTRHNIPNGPDDNPDHSKRDRWMGCGRIRKLLNQTIDHFPDHARHAVRHQILERRIKG
jgi:hypothetical protein